jgi:1,4-alpha-glucan branching enzyme
MDCAKLLLTAATNPGSALAMDYFAGALRATGDKRLVYVESHDEAGNSGGDSYPFYDPDWEDKDKKRTSHRTIYVAVNGSPWWAIHASMPKLGVALRGE